MVGVASQPPIAFLRASTSVARAAAAVVSSVGTFLPRYGRGHLPNINNQLVLHFHSHIIAAFQSEHVRTKFILLARSQLMHELMSYTSLS